MNNQEMQQVAAALLGEWDVVELMYETGLPYSDCLRMAKAIRRDAMQRRASAGIEALFSRPNNAICPVDWDELEAARSTAHPHVGGGARQWCSICRNFSAKCTGVKEGGR